MQQQNYTRIGIEQNSAQINETNDSKKYFKTLFLAVNKNKTKVTGAYL